MINLFEQNSPTESEDSTFERRLQEVRVENAQSETFTEEERQNLVDDWAVRDWMFFDVPLAKEQWRYARYSASAEFRDSEEFSRFYNRVRNCIEGC